MAVTMFIGAAIALLSWFFVRALGTSVLHEIEALVLMLISAVFFCGGGIVSALNRREESPALEQILALVRYIHKVLCDLADHARSDREDRAREIQDKLKNTDG